ncbi:glycoside hydrolase [Rugosimonospora africana]|uniref:Uncharacterized protein n=1 Tax=Rugosimonospora africana TaxID=556532 RepID=A0A8J3VNP9_9ACTN|nr:glycoside hydrolase [Rugosimonospora africana]GIH12448.1 hypothetical protein Raf01_06200 [Rugosimonospora africana]
MNQLRQLFEEAAGVPAPPSRLSAASVYARGRRRARFRMTAAGAVSAVAVAAAGSFAGLGFAGQGGPGPVPSRNDIHDGAVLSVAAADRNHLYEVIAACPSKDPHYSEPENCTDRLFGSDDSGRTWTLRNPDIDRESVGVLAPGVLAADPDAVEHDGFPGSSTFIPWQKKPTSPDTLNGDSSALISSDGGRTWTRWTPKDDPTPLAALPAGDWLACHWIRPPTGCALTANDPATGRSSPLAHQPPMNVEQVDDLSAGAGLWVSGQDRPSGYPAVGVSTDRGRTWSVHVFGPGESDHPGDGLHVQGAVPASADGKTVYVVVVSRAQHGPGQAFVYRSVDGGATWQRTDPNHTLPYADHMAGTSYVAADGTHIVYNLGSPPASWPASSDAGTSYRPAAWVPGLLRLTDPRGFVAAPGVYLVWDNDTVYRSTDGIRWLPLPTPAG